MGKQIFLNLSAEKMADKRVGELKKLGSDAPRLSVGECVERAKQAKLKIFRDETLRTLDDEKGCFQRKGITSQMGRPFAFPSLKSILLCLIK